MAERAVKAKKEVYDNWLCEACVAWSFMLTLKIKYHNSIFWYGLSKNMLSQNKPASYIMQNLYKCTTSVYPFIKIFCTYNNWKEVIWARISSSHRIKDNICKSCFQRDNLLTNTFTRGWKDRSLAQDQKLISIIKW